MHLGHLVIDHPAFLIEQLYFVQFQVCIGANSLLHQAAVQGRGLVSALEAQHNACTAACFQPNPGVAVAGAACIHDQVKRIVSSSLAPADTMSTCPSFASARFAAAKRSWYGKGSATSKVCKRSYCSLSNSLKLSVAHPLAVSYGCSALTVPGAKLSVGKSEKSSQRQASCLVGGNSGIQGLLPGKLAPGLGRGVQALQCGFQAQFTWKDLIGDDRYKAGVLTSILTHAPNHLQLDQAVHLHRVFHRQFLNQGFNEPADHHRGSLFIGETAAVQVEQLLFADFAHGCLMPDSHVLEFTSIVGYVRPGVFIQQQGITNHIAFVPWA